MTTTEGGKGGREGGIRDERAENRRVGKGKGDGGRAGELWSERAECVAVFIEGERESLIEMIFADSWLVGDGEESDHQGRLN